MITRLATVAAAAASLTLTLAVPADAGTYCPNGKICMWEDPSAQGSRYVEVYPGGVSWFYNIGGWNGDNEISSWENASSVSVKVFSNDNPTGRWRCLEPGTYQSSLGDFDNDAESFQVVSSC